MRTGKVVRTIVEARQGNEFIGRLLQGWNEAIERKYLWANLGPFGSDEPPGRHGGGAGLHLVEADLQRVDDAFALRAEASGRRICIVLGEEPAKRESSAFYARYEPAADFVFALSTRERRACLCTHEGRWTALRPQILDIQGRIDRVLAEGRFIDALMTCVDEVGTVSTLLDEKPWLPR